MKTGRLLVVLILCMLLTSLSPAQAIISVATGRQYYGSKSVFDVVYCPFTQQYWVKVKEEKFISIGDRKIHYDAQWHIYIINTNLTSMTYMFSSENIIYDLLPTEEGLIFEVERPFRTSVDVKLYDKATNSITDCIPTYADGVLAYSSGTVTYWRDGMLYSYNLTTEEENQITSAPERETWDQRYYYYQDPNTNTSRRMDLQTLSSEEYNGDIPSNVSLFFDEYRINKQQGLLTTNSHQSFDISSITTENVLAMDSTFLCGFSNTGELKYIELSAPHIVHSVSVPSCGTSNFSLANSCVFFLSEDSQGLIFVDLCSHSDSYFRIPFV